MTAIDRVEAVRDSDGRIREVRAWCTPASGWTIYVRLVPRAGRFVIAELRGFPGEAAEAPTRWTGSSVPGNGFAISWAQQFNLADLFAAVRAEVGDVSTPEPGGLLGPSWGTDPNPAGRIASVAWRYAALVERGEKRPNAKIAAHEGRSQQQIADDVREARRRGFLNPRKPGRGRPQGTLTPRGRYEVWSHLSDIDPELPERLGVAEWEQEG